jgi:hypothetical protein
MALREAKSFWWMLLAVGVLLRVLASFGTSGIVQPDENQQYMEIAQKIVYGYHHQTWEYDEGIRHYLYPWTLTCLLYSLDSVGIKDPLTQAALIRLIIAVSVFVPLALLAKRLIHHNQVYAGLFLILLPATNPDYLFISVRTLSETAVMVPLVLSMLVMPSSQLAAGVLLGLGFAIRFQSTFFIVAFWFVALVDDLRKPTSGIWSRPSVSLTCGLILGILATGGIDAVTWGTFFQSPIRYFDINILKNVASKFGVSPWYWYFPIALRIMFLNSPFIPFLLIIGAACDRRVGFVLLTFVAGHMVIGHKEFRFVWPALPLVFLLIAEGVEAVCGYLNPHRRMVFLGLLALSLAVGSAWRTWRIDWNMEPSRSSFIALAAVGAQPDLTGVALYGVPKSFSGNYFYLRRNVPFLVQEQLDLNSFINDPTWKSNKINYIITFKMYEKLFSKSHPVELKQVGKMVIYRLNPTSTVYYNR